MNRTWFNMSSAPKNAEIRLNLQDGYGAKHTFQFSPAKWSHEKQCWVSAKSGKPLAATPIGWQYLNDKSIRVPRGG